jgi:hypothetical protein
MDLTKYKESQRVVEFLIQYQDRFSMPKSASPLNERFDQDPCNVYN